MFCKYCGKSFEGTRCPACGKETILISCSNELERILAQKASSGVGVDENTYKQGYDVGYRKGLSEGYQNGINESKKADVPTNELPRKEKTVNIKMIAVLCGVVFAIGAVLSGFIANGIGYQAGYTKGTSEGETQVAALKAEFDSKYEDAKNEGIKEGENKAKEDYELELARLRETPTHSPTPILPSIETPVPANQILFSKKTTESIKTIQKRLLELGYLKGKEKKVCDGIYGDGTESAVRQFQEEMHISPASGEVDLQTYYALFPELFVEIDPGQEEKTDSKEGQNISDPVATDDNSTVTDENPTGNDEEPADNDKEPIVSDDEPEGPTQNNIFELLHLFNWPADMTFE